MTCSIFLFFWQIFVTLAGFFLVGIHSVKRRLKRRGIPAIFR